MNRYLCIHCHFYQPPRENPWLEAIEYQDSAFPDHDWNERIDIECYRPNGEARILRNNEMIDVANNYSKVSFNFGPTLLSWLEEKDPHTYRKILEGDRQSRERFGGHGSAIAQAYNHLILPLANTRDQETQIIWGLEDFRRRFQRDPESMWLPETAVNTEALELMARYGMKYVILAPRQAKAFRPLDPKAGWTSVQNERFDRNIPYLIQLPSGKSIAAFFYDGEISRAVAFEGLLHNGEVFAERLTSIFQDRKEPQLAHIATDGETYGHHHRHGEMALAYALRHFEECDSVSLTNYGQFLELSPPKMEIQIHENSSWSCAHGIERWQSDCGCNTGQGQGWTQNWRKPLRNAFDFIRDQVNPLYEKEMIKLGIDPWHARNRYIQVILDRSSDTICSFLSELSERSFSQDEVTQILRLMELQRHLLLMYTSCGWFFDEVSGVEGVQNLQYAYRAVELAQNTLGINLENAFVEKLQLIPSNLPELHDGRTIFERYVVPAKVDFMELGAHFAVTSVFEKYEKHNLIYCYDVLLEEHRIHMSGRATLSYGRGTIRSRVTLKTWPMMFGVIHLGDHNINAGVNDFKSESDYVNLIHDLKRNFNRGDFPNVIRSLDHWFGTCHYSLKDLFKNEQQKIINVLVKNSTGQIRDRFLEIYETNYPLVCYLADLQVPFPTIYKKIAEFTQSAEIQDALSAHPHEIDFDRIQKYLRESKSWEIRLDEAGISRKLEAAFSATLNEESFETLLRLIELSRALPFFFDLAEVQTRFFLWANGKDNDLIREIARELNIRLKA